MQVEIRVLSAIDGCKARSRDELPKRVSVGRRGRRSSSSLEVQEIGGGDQLMLLTLSQAIDCSLGTF